MLTLLWAKQKPSYGRWIACGGILGLSALARPNILLVGAAFVFWILIYFKSKSETQSKPLLYAGYFALGTILVLSPVTIRNYLKAKDLVLIASQGGMNFYIGNNPQSDGVSAFLPGARGTWWGLHDDAIRMAEEATHKKLKPSEVSRFWYGMGIKFAQDHPSDFLRLMIKKSALFLNGNELSNNQDIYFLAAKDGILKGLIWKWVIFFPFGIVLPLALLGMALSYRQFKDTLVLLLFVFVYALSIILFFVTTRYRVPVLPFLVIFCAYAVDWFSVKLRERRFSALGKFLLALILISIPANLDIPGYKGSGSGVVSLQYGLRLSGARRYLQRHQGIPTDA